MKVKCERDETVFEATPKPYPNTDCQTCSHNAEGDLYISCPTCGRWYFLHSKEHLDQAKKHAVTGPEPKAGDYVSDRVLTVMEEKKICLLVNDLFNWTLCVDGMEIRFDGITSADYFAEHYAGLEYEVKWEDRNK